MILSCKIDLRASATAFKILYYILVAGPISSVSFSMISDKTSSIADNEKAFLIGGLNMTFPIPFQLL